MKYLVLGPVVVTDGSEEVALGGKNQRRLLAVLLAHLGREVTVSALAEALWPTRPPASESHAVQTVVSRTRRALGTSRNDVATTPDGYRLASTDCDMVRFEELLMQAEAKHTESALELHDEALDLWRRPAFGALSDLEAVRLEAVHLD